MQRVIHRDIKSSNILLDENWNAKVSDMGLSKTGPANQPYTSLFTHAVGTPGYCDPQYMNSYILTKESDVYSFGVVLFEVICGRLCYNYSNGRLDILVPTWIEAYNQEKLHEIIFQHLMPPIDLTALEKISRIAVQCLQTSREKRPTMSRVVQDLEIALESQRPPNSYEDGLKDVVSSLKYRSCKVVKMLLSKGVFFNRGETWFSLNDYGEHCEMISIASCSVIPDHEHDRRICRHHSNYESRFTSCSYMTCGRSFKTRVKTQFLSPLVTYTVNLVFRCNNKLKEKATRQQYIAITYELKEEKYISRVHLTNKREHGWMVAALHKFTSNQSIVDLEIIFKSINPPTELEIEGIEFEPVDNISRASNMEIMLAKAKMPLRDMLAAALAMDESILNGDQMEKFIKFCPTKEEMELLQNYTGDKEMLCKCEQFFLEFMNVPRVESKLHVFLFKLQFNTKLAELKKSLNTINSACNEVRSSDKLMELGNLYMGNTFNKGTARGTAIGFKLDTLLKLTDTRASNSTTSAMHFFCKVVDSKSPALLDFHLDLVTLESATKIQLMKSLAEEMQAIIKGLEKVKQELDASAHDGPVSQVFRKTLNQFIGFAESEMASVMNLYNVVGRNADTLAIYFGEDPARCSFELVTRTLLKFVRLFRKAHAENYKQKRRDRITEKLRILQNLIPNGTKVDITTMLEEAVEYVKFLKLQIQLLSSDDMWMYAPIAYNGMAMGLYHINISQNLPS
ncbi:hypothetical protein QVD17_25322 [Tagetes erecta]|uniref:Formin-like protein n=1 Tax=Tagetes erecta TaxID=13708 RepID=A0AAD8KIW0_TARER|nr:hypothetical protein QVD17_25322 [Tagetes erecta]